MYLEIRKNGKLVSREAVDSPVVRLTNDKEMTLRKGEPHRIGDTEYLLVDEPVVDTKMPTFSQVGGQIGCPDSLPSHPTELGGFQILEIIGAGGMGVVYRAFEPKLHRVVAMKVLHPRINSHPAAAKRFRREAVLAANLSHPNIVPVFQIDDHEPPRYFTMEYVDGRSLQAKIDAEGLIPLPEAVRILLQACEALQYAHARHIIHRDIKPANILLQNHVERVRITDFGIAQDVSQVLAANTVTEGATSGTPAFTSPEQNLGEKVDERTDIFSLGMTMYCMLTGQVAFKAKNRQQLAMAFREQTPTPPSRLNPDVDDKLDNFVMKMIAVDVCSRYQTIQEVIDAVQHIAPGLVATRQSRPKRRPPSRLGTWALPLGTGLIFIAGVAGLALLSNDPPHINGRKLPPIAASMPSKPVPVSTVPTGQVLASVQGKPNGKIDIFAIDLEAKETVNLTTKHPGDFIQPRLSPDGRQVAAAQCKEGNVTGLCLVDKNGVQSVLQKPAIDLLGWHGPDRLMYLRQHAPGQADLWTVRTDGTEDTLLASSARGLKKVTGVAVSPDGAQMAWIWNPGRDAFATDVFLAKPDGTQEEAFSQLPGSEADPIWSSDGKRLFWRHEPSSGSNQYTIVTKALGEAQPRTLSLRRECSFTLNGILPGDRYLVCIFLEGVPRVALVDTQTGQDQVLLTAHKVFGASCGPTMLNLKAAERTTSPASGPSTAPAGK